METISPDLAGKVLTANQRNIIAKVGSGKTLSGPEVKAFEEVLAQQRELQERRLAALLRRYCDGGRLTADEREEIADLVPPAGSGEEPAPEAIKYQKSRTVYAKLYDQTPRTINRWIAHGKSQGAPPPLDDPAAMSGWWTKHMKHRVPAALLQFKPTVPSPPPVAAATSQPELPSASSVTGDTAVGEPVRGSVGMVGMLKRMRDAEREASEKYQIAQAQEPPDPALIEMRRRAWERMAETLRKLEKDSPGILEASGDSLPREETLAELGQLLGVLAQTWRGFARRMLPVMRGMTIEQADKHWLLESDRVFAGFQENRFTKVVELSEE